MFNDIKSLIKDFNDLAISIGCQRIKNTEPRFMFEYAELKHRAMIIEHELYMLSLKPNLSQPRFLISRLLHPKKFRKLSRYEYIRDIHKARMLIHEIIETCSHSISVFIAN